MTIAAIIAGMSRSSGAMHVARIPSRYVSKSGEERRYESVLLRRTFRQEGKVRHETLANLTGLPEESIEALRATLKGRTLVDAEAAFEVERSVPHGDVAAAHVMASQLGLRRPARPGLPGTRHRLRADRCRGRCGRSRSCPPRAGGRAVTPRWAPTWAWPTPAPMRSTPRWTG